MAQHFTGDTKKFTLTAFLSFAIIFCLLVLMANCHGPYHPAGSAHGNKGGHGTEHKATESHEQKAAPSTKDAGGHAPEHH